MTAATGQAGMCPRLPPCGGSGLKYKAHRKQGHHTGGLPPCGGSGLKCVL